MIAARKQWTDEHQRQLRQARLDAAVSDVAFARDNAITLRHLQQLEDGGSTAFYSESIKYDMGVKLLRRLGVEQPVAVERTEVSSQETLETALQPVAAVQSAPAHDEPSASATDTITDMATHTPTISTRMPSIVLSLVGLGLIGAGISWIPSIHQSGAVPAVTQSTDVAAQPMPVPSGAGNLPAMRDPGAPSTLAPTRATAGTTATTADARPLLTSPTSLSEACGPSGASQTIVPSQPSKSADYVYLTAVSDVTVCVRDAVGRITRKSLRAGQSFNIPGRQPFDVTADQLHQLRVFFQGQRIWFQAEATRLRLTAATASD